jgi:hypothetical protein
MIRADPDRRMLQIAIGCGIVALLAVTVCAALLGWGYLPGALGEWVGTMIGAMTSPFLMETSFLVSGLCIVVLLNHWRRKRDGDDFVHLEQVEQGEVPDGVPDHAKWAVYQEKPLPGETPSLLARAEGAMAIGDFTAAAECVAAMEGSELGRPETLALRLELARATGREELVRDLEKRRDS